MSSRVISLLKNEEVNKLNRSRHKEIGAMCKTCSKLP